MHRRDYLAGTGAVCIGGVGAAGTRESASIDRRGSVDTLTVTPGSTVLFEVEVPDDVEPSAVEWAFGDLSGGPLVAMSDATDTAVRTAQFEAVGSYTVRASHDGTTVEWDVEVVADGREPPTIESLTTTPGPGETVGVDDAVEVTARAVDPEGDLDRLVWVEGRNYTVVEIEAIQGDTATATLSLAETPHWIDFGYPTVAYPVCADGRVGSGATSDGPTVRQPFTLDIVETNAPVAAGERFTATVAVENVGDMMMVGPNTQEIRLVVGGEVVDARSVTLEWAESTTIQLGYDTYPVKRDVSFPVRVEGADDAVTEEIEVSGTD